MVDLPQPDSPTSASVSPAARSKLTCSTACTGRRPGRRSPTDVEARGQLARPAAAACSRPRTVSPPARAGCRRRPRRAIGNFAAHLRRAWRRAAARPRAARVYRAASALRRSLRPSLSSTFSPRVHHHDPVGNFGDHAHVVRDEDHRHVHLVLQQADQRQDLRLDGHVERRRRLVGDQQRGRQDSAIAIITRWRMPPDN